MFTDWDFDGFEAYMNRLSAVSGIPLVNSVKDAKGRWGLRRLSRSEFKLLEAQLERDCELAARWQSRLQFGYEREQSQVALEIEETFADTPSAIQSNGQTREDAA
jgi:hypothetical protein